MVCRKGLLGIGFALVLSACGGGGDSQNTACDTPLTVSYVNFEFQTEELFVLSDLSASDTTLVHEDGDQGNTFDLDTIILSRTTHPSGDGLALSYSIHTTTKPSNDTYVAFYIDTDKDAMTGQPLDGIGADALILDGPTAMEVDEPTLPVSLGRYQTWNETSLSWVPQSKFGTTSMLASYLQGCTLKSGIYVPMYMGLDSLYAVNVRGVMKLIRLNNGDPNAPVLVAPLDSTSVFDFMVP